MFHAYSFMSESQDESIARRNEKRFSSQETCDLRLSSLICDKSKYKYWEKCAHREA